MAVPGTVLLLVNASPQTVRRLRNYDVHIQFTGKKEAIEAITELEKDAFIISILQHRYSTICIFRAITKKNIPYSVLGPFLSVYECQAGRSHSVLTKLLRVTPTRLAQHLEMLPARLPASFFGIRPATFVFAGGEKTRVTVVL